MKERQFSGTLNQIVEQEVPASLDLWPAIRAQVRSRHRTAWWARLKPATGLGWALTALIISLAFGAVVYAAAPAVMQLFRQAPILPEVAQGDLIHELDVSETVGNVTVRLERAYADANRVVIGFTVQGPEGRQFELNQLALTDAAGTVLPWVHGYGAAGESEILDLSLPPGEETHANVFDASSVSGEPETLNLRLTMELEELPLAPEAPDSTSATVGSLNDPPASTVVELQPMPSGLTVGNFEFEFSVPFIQGRAIEVGQTVEASGVAVTLEKVVATPSEMRATLCFEPPDASGKSWLIIASEAHDLSDGTDACHPVVYPANLADGPGRARLEVSELVGFDEVAPWGQMRRKGPWIFRFRVP
jgi:hypothetical protein